MNVLKTHDRDIPVIPVYSNSFSKCYKQEQGKGIKT